MLKDNEMSIKGDYYQAGCVLYEMIVGIPPYFD